MRESEIRFIRQQGLTTPNPDHELFSALMLQPRIIGAVFVLGVLLQSPWLFVALSAVLAWSAVVPTHSPFDAIYNHLFAYRRGLRPLGAAPAPRRFAQTLAAAMALVIGGALLTNASITAWILEGLFGAAMSVTIFGRFCSPAALYHLIRGMQSARHSESQRMLTRVNEQVRWVDRSQDSFNESWRQS